MTLLHMNVDACRALSQKMDGMRTTLASETQAVQTQVGSTIGADWIAPSAEQFRQEMADWQTRLDALLTAMDEVRRRLDSEVAEWEAMAGRF